MQSYYIHWPFCPYRCHFCPFVAYLKNDTFLKPYHDALTQEIYAYGNTLNKKDQLKTIYFGGGTPSTYPDELLLDMFGTLNKVSSCNADTEITIEVNPGAVSEDKVHFWRRLGINRLSIGVQSLNDQALQKVNRLQTAEDVYDILAYADGVFENVSVDFILGLPEVTHKQWKEYMHQAVQWPIAHISIYFLMVHEFTPLFYRLKKKELDLPLDDDLVDLYCWTVSFLAEHGFEQYEISSFAKQGFQSQHNKAYWAREPFRGFGVGAWSFDGTKRFRNKKNLMLYMKGSKQGDIRTFEETITDEQATLEHLMLSLRQASGMSCKEYFAHIPLEKHTQAQEHIDSLRAQGLLKDRDDVIQLTPRGCAVEQKVIAQLSL